MSLRARLGLLLLAPILGSLAGCSHPVQVLSVPPPTAYRTLGMLSGQGENESSAISQVIEQASRMDADAVVIVGRRPVGSVLIVTAKAIKYIGPPPGANPEPAGPGAPPPPPPPQGAPAPQGTPAPDPF